MCAQTYFYKQNKTFIANFFTATALIPTTSAETELTPLSCLGKRIKIINNQTSGYWGFDKKFISANCKVNFSPAEFLNRENIVMAVNVFYSTEGKGFITYPASEFE